MLCEMCREKEANVVIQTISGNKVLTRSLCADCAKKTQTEIARAFFALGMRLQQAAQPAAPEAPAREAMPRRICSACGTPVGRVDGDTLLGCPACYDAFPDMIEKAYPGTGESGGALPEAAESRDEGEACEDEKEKLAERLRLAVFAEDYELAAALRDRLKGLAPDGEAGGKGHG